MGRTRANAARPEHRQRAPLEAAALRWRCDPKSLGFRTTADVPPATGVLGQDDAVESLRFGLATDAPGQHIFVRGLGGSKRMALVGRLVRELRPDKPPAPDRCYVRNFEQPDRPRLITLPPGKGEEFRRRVDDLIDFIREELGRALGAEPIRRQKESLEKRARERLRAVAEPVEKAAKKAGLAVAQVETDSLTQATLLPVVDGQPVSPEQFEQLHREKKVSEKQVRAYQTRAEALLPRLEAALAQAAEVTHEHEQAVAAFLREHARLVLQRPVKRIEGAFPEPAAREFLAGLVDDAVDRRLRQGEDGGDFTRLYRVNVVAHRKAAERSPVVLESAPTVANLIGAVERGLTRSGQSRADHMLVQPGSLLRADGGFLVLEARDVLAEQGAWTTLMRALRTGRLEIVPGDQGPLGGPPTVKPEPIDLDVKVVLIGDDEAYYLLDELDWDFPRLFKVLADFDDVAPRNKRGFAYYAGVLSRIAHEEELPAFDAGAVAALIEHGARIAARAKRLTARFGRVADIAREAAFVARADGRATVGAGDVTNAVRRTKRRADLPARRFRELVADGTIRVQTRGDVVGQINGLAVLRAGPLSYGFPARITATIGAGRAGLINIERESELSGAIHTKGFYILGGLLRKLLGVDHPLAFDASIAFEQSYGAIDGDSASGAEICCLLSALTDTPIRQGVAMTGAVDQMGQVLAIGAVNEKIEGFYDACADSGLTGDQGAIIPASNAGDLMLREDVVDACAEGAFRVWGVATVHEALAILTGAQVGRPGRNGRYPAGSLLARAADRARVYWENSSVGSRS